MCACVRACVRACYGRACVRACCVHVYILHAHMKNNAVTVVPLSKRQRRHKRHCSADDSWILDDLFSFTLEWIYFIHCCLAQLCACLLASVTAISLVDNYNDSCR